MNKARMFYSTVVATGVGRPTVNIYSVASIKTQWEPVLLI